MPPTDERSDRRHRLLLFALSVLLLAFSAWCVDLWIEQGRLRTQLDTRLGWLGELRQLESRLDDPDTGALVDPGDLERLRRIAAGDAEDPAIQIAARRLLDTLRSSEPETAAGLEDEDAFRDAAWAARVGAREASADLQAALLANLGSLHGGLRRHWASIGVLVVSSLALAASNLALLGLAHRRRRALEVAHLQAVELASHDHLTGLWNREEILNLLRRELARVRRSPVSLGLVLADLDDFRATNDFLGQDEGDRVLRQVAERYLARLRPYDQVGRFGGDSFLFVLPNCDLVAARSVADRLHRAMEEPFEHRHGQVELSATVSWTAAQGPRDLDPDNVVRRLLEAFEEARRTSRGRVQDPPARI